MIDQTPEKPFGAGLVSRLYAKFANPGQLEVLLALGDQVLVSGMTSGAVKQ